MIEDYLKQLKKFHKDRKHKAYYSFLLAKGKKFGPLTKITDPKTKKIGD